MSESEKARKIYAGVGRLLAKIVVIGAAIAVKTQRSVVDPRRSIRAINPNRLSPAAAEITYYDGDRD